MFKVPGLENYNGCKGNNGVYQQIISLIPPHETLVVPFLGHCGIVRNIKPCKRLICMDASEKVVKCWFNYLASLKYDVQLDVTGTRFFFTANKNTTGELPPEIFLFCTDSIEFMKTELYHFIPKSDYTPVLYMDPPYPFSTRKSKAKLYKHEMTDKQHLDLLSIIIKMNDQRYSLLISSYENEVYNNVLKSFYDHSFTAGTRNGKATEIVYYNHSVADGQLHDYRYLGKNYKDRERIKLKIERWANRLKNLDPREREAIMHKLNEI